MKKVLNRVFGALVWALVFGILAGPAQSAQKPFTIGLSNGFIGSEWRTQMIEDVQAVFEEYKKEGLVDRLIVQSANVDVTGQIRQIRNMIAAGVDAIIVNPNSQTALNPVFEEAKQRGILVIAIDQAVTSQHALNVVIDQSEWAKIQARWLAQRLDGKGNIVVINGIAGHPANEDRWNGAKAVFAQYPGIKILTVANANWDQATGQQVMSNLLATYPNIDGLFTQDGMAEGALRAIMAAGSKLPAVTGEARVGYLRLWQKLQDEKGFSTIGVVNPPGIAASGLRIAVNLLQGRQLKDGVVKGNTLYVPIPAVITNENLAEYWNKYKNKPDSYTLDGYLTEQEARAYFK